jgi:hypothetical protein
MDTYGTSVAQELFTVWKRHANSEEIEIREMEDEHLLATIAMIQRGRDASGRRVPQDRDRYLPSLEDEAVRRSLKVREDGWDA